MSAWRLGEGVLASGGEPARYFTLVETGVTYEMNETAAEVIMLLRQGGDVGGAAETLARRHPDAPREDIERDVREVVGECERLGLLARS